MFSCMNQKWTSIVVRILNVSCFGRESKRKFYYWRIKFIVEIVVAETVKCVSFVYGTVIYQAVTLLSERDFSFFISIVCMVAILTLFYFNEIILNSRQNWMGWGIPETINKEPYSIYSQIMEKVMFGNLRKEADEAKINMHKTQILLQKCIDIC